MSKVSIGLRGWRFEESEVFTPDGEYRPLAEMPPDTRTRVQRLAALVGSPCHACWLLHGDAGLDDCNVARVVYGEPNAEVVTCDDHESDFLYWYRECGGSEHRGDPSLQDAFHAWFETGGRAPDGYAADEHVDTAPETLPDPPVENASCDVVLGDLDEDDGAGRDAPDPAESATDETTADTGTSAAADESSDIDLGQEYPT
jgi:hypothetical protein